MKQATILVTGADKMTVDFTKGPEADTRDEAMRRALYANDANLSGWIASDHSRRNHPGMPSWMADALIIAV